VPSDAGLAWYYELISRIQGVVHDAVPAHSTVLVVSRGDEHLLRLGNRKGWHFPRHADGRYAGYHPADSAVAISHLEELREKGAQYIVFPASTRWWLDYYEGFADHLNGRYSAVADDEGTCTIYALRPQSGAKVMKEGGRRSSHLDDFVGTLLPGVPIAVLSLAGSPIPLRGQKAVAFPSAECRDDGESALEELDDMAADGIQFLVVPHSTPSWLDDHPGFMSELEQRHRTVAAQQYVCTVFELCPPGPERDQPSPGAASRVRPWWRRALRS